MNRRISTATATLLCLAASVLPATAGDWNNGAGSLKDRGHPAVPVPAPYPVYDGPSGWYLRADVGIGREGNHGWSESGLAYGAGNGVDSYSTDGSGFGSMPGWFGNSTDVNVGYGVGVGYAWNKNWRSDVTLDRRSTTQYKMRGTYSYQQHRLNPVPPTDYVAAADTEVRGVSDDRTEMRSGVMMLNTYYDWANRSAFTPYVGLGVGLAYLDMAREHTTTEQECDVSLPAAPACANRAGWSEKANDTKLLWAAAAHAGFSYAITPVTSLDVNYRFLYIPTANVDMTLNGNRSRASINEITEHQLRAGLRWNIN